MNQILNKSFLQLHNYMRKKFIIECDPIILLCTSCLNVVTMYLFQLGVSTAQNLPYESSLPSLLASVYILLNSCSDPTHMFLSGYNSLPLHTSQHLHNESAAYGLVT